MWITQIWVKFLKYEIIVNRFSLRCVPPIVSVAFIYTANAQTLIFKM